MWNVLALLVIGGVALLLWDVLTFFLIAEKKVRHNSRKTKKTLFFKKGVESILTNRSLFLEKRRLTHSKVIIIG